MQVAEQKWNFDWAQNISDKSANAGQARHFSHYLPIIHCFRSRRPVCPLALSTNRPLRFPTRLRNHSIGRISSQDD